MPPLAQGVHPGVQVQGTMTIPQWVLVIYLWVQIIIGIPHYGVPKKEILAIMAT